MHQDLKRAEQRPTGCYAKYTLHLREEHPASSRWEVHPASSRWEVHPASSRWEEHPASSTLEYTRSRAGKNTRHLREVLSASTRWDTWKNTKCRRTPSIFAPGKTPGICEKTTRHQRNILFPKTDRISTSNGKTNNLEGLLVGIDLRVDIMARGF